MKKVGKCMCGGEICEKERIIATREKPIDFGGGVTLIDASVTSIWCTLCNEKFKRVKYGPENIYQYDQI